MHATIGPQRHSTFFNSQILALLLWILHRPMLVLHHDGKEMLERGPQPSLHLRQVKLIAQRELGLFQV